MTAQATPTGEPLAPRPVAPTPVYQIRTYDASQVEAARAAGYHPLAARVIAARFPDLGLVEAEITDIDPPTGLPDIERGAERLAQAIMNGEVIGLETDHDVDGVSSHAVLWTALTEFFLHPKEKVRSFIGHRIKEGYGLSESLATRILADEQRPTLLVTADNGSSDEPRIARLKAAAGIETIVTDHHEIPVEGHPESAYACITPKRPDSTYPDPKIAGCHVAFLLAAATRQALIRAGYLNEQAPRLTSLLDYVALGTVADCVSMSRSRNNRAIVRAGLKLMSQCTRPCWRAIRRFVLREGEDFSAYTLGFGIGPRINARGRLDEAMAGVHFLVADSDLRAAELAELLDTENTERKKIERGLLDEAELTADQLADQGYQSLVVWLPEGHAGVHGIVASRIVERHGRPAIMLSPKFGSDELISGSARGIPGFHVRDALQAVADAHPGLFVAFGGHEGAAGMTLRRQDIERFRDAFETAARQQLGEQDLYPVRWTDGGLEAEEFTLEAAEALVALGPYGQECPAPVFENALEIREIVPVGRGEKGKVHMKLSLGLPGEAAASAIMFNVIEHEDDPLPFAVGDLRTFAYTLDINEFRGNRTVQLKIESLVEK